MYECTGEAPWLGLALHVNLAVVSVKSATEGFDGGPGNVVGSGVRRKMMEGSVGVSTTRAALQDVSPVSLDALHVYQPVSALRRSSKHRHHSMGKCNGSKLVSRTNKSRTLRP